MGVRSESSAVGPFIYATVYGTVVTLKKTKEQVLK